MAFIAIHVPGTDTTEGYWALLDAASGEMLGPEYRFESQERAEEMADSMNGVELDEKG
jgi:hypothetical protein